jgi:hypothetical protein
MVTSDLHLSQQVLPVHTQHQHSMQRSCLWHMLVDHKDHATPNSSCREESYI